MLSYVYERLVLLAEEANHYIIAGDKQINPKKLRLDIENMREFINELKNGFAGISEALDEIAWLWTVAIFLYAY